MEKDFLIKTWKLLIIKEETDKSDCLKLTSPKEKSEKPKLKAILQNTWSGS